MQPHPQAQRPSVDQALTVKNFVGALHDRLKMEKEIREQNKITIDSLEKMIEVLKEIE